MVEKVLLLVAIVCMLVPFMVLGFTVHAEFTNVPNYSSPSLSASLNFGYTSYRYDLSTSSSYFTWNGERYFSRNFTLDSSAVSSPFYLPWGHTSMNWHFGPGDSSSDYDVFAFDVNAGLDLTAENRNITFTVPEDGLEHTFVVLVCFTAVDLPSLNDLTVEYTSQYVLNNSVFPYVHPMTISLNDISDGYQRITLALGGNNDLNYSLTSSSSDFPSSTETFLSFTRRNRFVVYSSAVSPGNYTLSCSDRASGTVLAVFDMALYSDSYQQGFNVGYSEGFNDGSVIGSEESFNAGKQAGIQQANNTVNKNSASYQQGLTDGRADGQDYTFLGLIGAVIDAPINALFGHTTADGVFHPGLFSIEILGMDMSAFILSIFTLALIIAILRLCLGGK